MTNDDEVESWSLSSFLLAVSAAQKFQNSSTWCICSVFKKVADYDREKRSTWETFHMSNLRRALYLVLPVIVIASMQCLSCSLGQNKKVNIANVWIANLKLMSWYLHIQSRLECQSISNLLDMIIKLHFCLFFWFWKLSWFIRPCFVMKCQTIELLLSFQKVFSFKFLQILC